MTDTTAPRAAAAVTQRWLDSWPEGATYTFTKDQIETVIASVRLDEAEAIGAIEGPDHPHDGYAYDGCRCSCCLAIRVAQQAPAIETPLRKAALAAKRLPLSEHTRTLASPGTPDARQEETEPCPTCWQPVPVPQRGDHDYGINLRAATPDATVADLAERVRALPTLGEVPVKHGSFEPGQPRGAGIVYVNTVDRAAVLALIEESAASDPLRTAVKDVIAILEGPGRDDKRRLAAVYDATERLRAALASSAESTGGSR
jgi:hypothetical protein